jgi:hypothetical protein
MRRSIHTLKKFRMTLQGWVRQEQEDEEDEIVDSDTDEQLEESPTPWDGLCRTASSERRIPELDLDEDGRPLPPSQVALGKRGREFEPESTVSSKRVRAAHIGTIPAFHTVTHISFALSFRLDLLLYLTLSIRDIISDQ